MVRPPERGGCGEGDNGRYEIGSRKPVQRKGVSGGVFECKIDFGPGYRVYFGKDGDRLVILLGGGTKKRQQRDINEAISRWQDYKRRKAKKGKGRNCNGVNQGF
jgi:putative addiction module killer protein